jgi:hypothetical protein
MRQPNVCPVLLKNGDEGYQLEEDYQYTWEGPDGCKRSINVPYGFIYDGASVPRIAWTLSGITPDGLLRPAALIHDFLYRYAGHLPRNSYGMLKDGYWRDLYGAVWSRKDCDRLFARIMREAGVSKVKRRLAYSGVRSFGWMSWKGK